MRYLRNLKTLRKQRKMTQQDLAEAIGVEQPTVQRYEAGRVPSLEVASAIAEALGVTLNDLVAETEFAPLGPRLFVKGEVVAGVWKEAWEFDQDDWEVFTGRADVSAPVRERFGLRVVGDSMNELYPDGTIVDCHYYHGDYEIPSGKRVVVQRWRADSTVETTVKELHRTDDGVEWLRPRSTNPQFQAFRGDQPNDPDVVKVEIFAVVDGSYRPE